jgi:para-aminobenzoate synthetase component 1
MSTVILHSDSGIIRYAWGEKSLYEVNDAINWSELELFLKENENEQKFVFLSYDLGKEVLPVKRLNKSTLPLIRVWVPKQYVEVSKEGKLKLVNISLEEFESRKNDLNKKEIPKFNWKTDSTKQQYIEKVNYLKSHIQYGNIYEINFCQNLKAELELDFNVLGLYNHLYEKNPTPFSFYFDSKEWALCSSSPERFLKKTGSKLISQPIKGTTKRGTTKEEDEALKVQLLADPKERSENVMIVDLVRNDLSKIAKKASVQVDELCGLFSYPTVHQLISTVSCEIESKTTFSDIIKATFPMGSMTGAPKISAMNFAEENEGFSREAYSGSFGYMDSNGDFDLNVIIRTLVFNKNKKEVTCSVGGAITIHSDAEKEYEECKTKVSKIINLFGTCPL